MSWSTDYDLIGNLLQKSDFASSYAYGAVGRANRANAGPHAVRSIVRNGQGTVSDFRYDHNGNMIAGDGRLIEYAVFNKPTTITEGNVVTRFFYDPQRARYKQEAPGRVTRYVEGLYEEVTSGGTVEQKVYVGSHVLVTQNTGRSGRRVEWLHKDHLGSVETVTDKQGTRLESHGYSPFGVPWRSTWTEKDGLLHSGEFASEATTRGFTGHEHVDQHRLIHMNGRAY